MFIKEDFKMDFNKIKEAAQNYERDMTKFLREIVNSRARAAMRKHILTALQRK